MAEEMRTGIFFDIPFDEYLSWDATSCSLLKAFAHTPALYKYRRKHPEQDKPAYLLGRLFHMLSTHPEEADKEFILRPRTYHHPKDQEGIERPWNGNAKECKAWLAANANKTVVRSNDMDMARQMAENVRNHPKVGALVRDTHCEVSCLWLDDTTGLYLKGRWDVWKPGSGIILDLKSASTAKPDLFFRFAYQHKYHLQAAMYIDAMKALDPTDKTAWFVFVVCENYPPYSVAAYDVHDDPQAVSWDFLDLGRKTYKTLLQQLKWCIEHDDWPGYGDEHRDMMLPPYVKDADLYEMS